MSLQKSSSRWAHLNVLLGGMLGFCARAGFFIRVGLEGLGEGGAAVTSEEAPMPLSISSRGTPAIS